MQLPLTTGALVPVGVGVAVAIVLILLILFAYRRKRAAGTPDGSQHTAGDWTGEFPHHAAGPAPMMMNERFAEWTPGAAPPVAPQSAAPQSAPQSPPQSAVAANAGEASPAAGVQKIGHQESAAAPRAGKPERAADRSSADRSSTDAVPGAPTSGTSVPVARTGGAPPHLPEDPASRSGPDARPLPNDATGSSSSVAAAVAKAFATRAAQGRAVPLESRIAQGRAVPVEPPPPTAEKEDVERSPVPPPPPSTPASRTDARDRLLAVLLDDPAEAVGALTELEACRRQTREVLHRLVELGLRQEQLARLAGLSVDEVRVLMAPVAG